MALIRATNVGSTRSSKSPLKSSFKPQRAPSRRFKKRALRRACSDSDKQCRKDEILYSATKLFAAKPFENISMDEVASLAGVAKGTLYLYFETKEEVFLSLLKQSYSQWLDRFDAWIEGEANWRRFAEQLTSLISQEKRLLRLLAVLHGSLERNLPRQAAREFRTWLNERFEASAERMSRKLKTISEAQAKHLLLQIHCVTVGSYAMAHTGGVFDTDFKTMFYSMIAAVSVSFAERRTRRANSV